MAECIEDVEPGICPLHDTPSTAVVTTDYTRMPDLPPVLLAWRCTDPAWATHTWWLMSIEHAGLGVHSKRSKTVSWTCPHCDRGPYQAEPDTMITCICGRTTRSSSVTEDWRECGWLGCGDERCEPYCAGVHQHTTRVQTRGNSGETESPPLHTATDTHAQSHLVTRRSNSE